MNSDISGWLGRNRILGVGGALIASILLFSSGQVVAQEDADEGSSANVLMDEITVSARRRTERLLDQPMSISAMTAEQMAVLGVVRVDEVSKYVPNVVLTTDDRANNTRVVIRGSGGGFPDPVFVFGSGICMTRSATASASRSNGSLAV